jgi:hypothetical protein
MNVQRNKEGRTMRKLIMCICTFVMVFMFVSCQTSTKPTPPAATTGIHNNTLDGKWNGTVSWRTAYRTGSSGLSVMIQEGTAVMESTSGTKMSGTLEGNTIHVKSTDWTNSEGTRIHYPDREFHISEDGKTITIDFDGSWHSQARGDDATGWVEVDGTLTRE